MFDAHTAFSLLEKSEQLDRLLKVARAETTKLSAPSVVSVEDLEKKAEKVTAKAKSTSDYIRRSLAADALTSEQKAAAVVHMVLLGSKVLG